MQQQTIESFQDWQKFGFHILDDEVPHKLVLSQTYQEWLRENPKGFIPYS